MKSKYFLIVLSIVFATGLTAQNTENWQWAKRGGGPGQFTTSPLWARDFERVVDMAIDNDNNYYFLTEISGQFNVDYDGTPINVFNDSNNQYRDIYVFSTDSEGNFRWDKVIGGGEYDRATTIAADNQNNIYISGRTMPIPGGTAVHFDTDSIRNAPSDLFEISSANKGAFVIKYDQEGDFQWLREPEGANPYVNAEYNSLMGWVMKTVLEENGRSHNLVFLKEGTHLEGALTVPEGETQTVLVIYDANGNLEKFLTIDMKPVIELPTFFYDYQLAYDPNLERYYIADYYRNGSPSINGYGEDDDEHGFYLAALDNQGEVLWYRQNVQGGAVGDLKLDQDGNIYLTGKFNSNGVEDSFAGYVFTYDESAYDRIPFLVKLDPEGNLIWGTNARKLSEFSGQAIAFDGPYVYLGLPILSNTWGNLTIPSGPEGVGYVPDPAIIRFDAETGQSLDVFWVRGTSLSRNGFTALKVDLNGDLVGGGYFAQNLFFGDEFSLTNQAGGPSDFFIAKNQPEEIPCLTPLALTVEKVANDAIKATWQPRQGETQWEVNYGERLFPPTYHKDYNPYIGGTVVAVEDTPELVIEGLDFTAQHAVYVRAICSANHQSGWSAAVYLNLQAMQVGTCERPGEILVENLTGTSAYISWTAQNDQTGWVLAYGYVGFDPNTEGQQMTVEGTPEATLEDLIPNRDYQVYVRAVCNAQNLSAWSDPKSFSTLGVKTLEPPIKITIYPNPTTGILNLDTQTAIQTYDLYDLRGRLVQQGRTDNHQIDLSNQYNGLYFLRLLTPEGKSVMLKVVKK